MSFYQIQLRKAQLPKLSQIRIVDFLFKKMDSGTVRHNIDMTIGETVRINDGPFKDLEGKVNSVDQDRGKVKVLVSMFGRETPVELDFLQVKKI